MFYTIVTDVNWVYLRTLLSKREGAILVVVEGLFLSLVITEISLSKITFLFLTGGDRLSDRGPAQWRSLKFECHFEGPPVNEILSQLAERKVSVPCLSIGSHFCRNHQIRRPLKLTNTHHHHLWISRVWMSNTTQLSEKKNKNAKFEAKLSKIMHSLNLWLHTHKKN